MIGELARYGLVGSLTSVTFAVLVWVFNATTGASLAATVFSYVLAMSVQFLGHARFTFKHVPPPPDQSGNFILTHMLGVAISLACINVIAPAAGLEPQHAALGVICLLATLNFILFRFWVFAKSSNRKRT